MGLQKKQRRKLELYDKTRCESDFFKGYSGCLCRYCEAYANQDGPWEAGFHGSGDGDREYFVARVTYRHAFASWGWDGPDKIILKGGPAHKAMLAVCKIIAKELNKIKA